MKRCLILLLLLFPATAWAALPPRFGGALRTSIRERMSPIDPTLAVEDDQMALVSCLYETLIVEADSGNLSALLLEKLPDVSPDGLTYAFQIKEDVRFHNGDVLSSKDVESTVTRLLRSRRSPYAWIFGGVAGAADFRNKKAKTLSGFRIVDPLRFEIRLSKPDRNFLRYLTFPAASILPAGVGADQHVGTGPFKFLKSSGGSVTLVANQNYHRGRPYVDSVSFRVIANREDALVEFKAGKLDLVDVPRGGLEKGDLRNYAVNKSPMKRIYFLDINPSGPELEDREMRRGVSEAVDRKGIVNVVLNGYGSIEDNVPRGHAEKFKADPNADKLLFWYPAHDKALANVADRVRFNLDRAGLPLKIEAKERYDLMDISARSAPALILRSLPVLSSLPASIDQVLYSGIYGSPCAAMAIRLGGAKPHVGSADVDVIFLFSQRRQIVSNPQIQNVNFVSFGAPDFQEMFYRDKKK